MFILWERIRLFCLLHNISSSLSLTFFVFPHSPCPQIFSLVVFASIVNEGYVNIGSERLYCVFNKNADACNYGVFVGLVGLLACTFFALLDYKFSTISSIKDRKKAVMLEIGFSGKEALISGNVRFGNVSRIAKTFIVRLCFDGCVCSIKMRSLLMPDQVDGQDSKDWNSPKCVPLGSIFYFKCRFS